MTITGHETAQIFRRYAGLVDPEEQKAAFAAREAFLENERAKQSDVTQIQHDKPKETASQLLTPVLRSPFSLRAHRS